MSRQHPLSPRPAVERMRPYHPPLEGRDGLRLDFNEHTGGCSPRALAALRALSATDLARYPEYGPAQGAIAAQLGLPADAVVLTNGVDDAIFLTLATFADPGDSVVIVEPTFAMYRFYAERAGLTIQSLRYHDQPSSDGRPGREFTLDAAVLEAALAGPSAPRVVLLANPNNPTGSWLPSAAILPLAARYPETLFFVDEAYADFSPDPAGLLAAVSHHPNLIVARTFSKAHGLAALRLGLLAAPPALLPYLRRAHAPYNVNLAALVCAQAALEDHVWLAAYRREVLASRASLEAELARLGLTWWRSAGNFVLFRAEREGDPRPAADLVRRFRSAGILVRDRGRDVPASVRITCGRPGDTDRAIAILAEYYGHPAGPHVAAAATPAAPSPPSATAPLPQSAGGSTRPAAARRPEALAVFDMDGVLVDVSGSYRRAIAATVAELGGDGIPPVTDEEIQAMKDGGGYNNDWELTRELLRRRGRVIALRTVTSAFNRLYHGMNGEGLRRTERWLLSPQALEAWRRQFRLAIFTGRPREEAQAALREFGVADAFECCVGMEDVARGKPAPDGLLQLAARFPRAPIAAFLGDTVDDAQAARAAAVPFIGVLPPGHADPGSLSARFRQIGCLGVVAHAAAGLELLSPAAPPREALRP
ncbi:MAG: aminotransferase class I/II-fold pyridoxal phosphate-dependent enzyme [Terriglobales bacterium]